MSSGHSDGLSDGISDRAAIGPVLNSRDYIHRLSSTNLSARPQFEPGDRDSFGLWREQSLARIWDLISDGALERSIPKPPDTDILSEREWYDVTRTELVYRNDRYDLVVPATILSPQSEKANGAGIVCQHGHGRFGRLSVIGDAETPQKREEIELLKYDYGLALAKAGYTVIAIDLINFGSRGMQPGNGRDNCDMIGLWMSLFGLNAVSMMVSDVRLAVSVLSSRRGVDAARIGMTGLSQGGRITMFCTVLDQRIKAAVASGASNTYRDRLAAWSGICGVQTVPGMLPELDTPELFATIAPRPLQVQRGLSDPLLDQDAASEGTKFIAGCYAAAGAADRFADYTFGGGHEYAANPAIEWFDRWL